MPITDTVNILIFGCREMEDLLHAVKPHPHLKPNLLPKPHPHLNP